ncbi:MAG: hypothetical protein KQH57_13795 [Actinomycetales bacterium]|nr:hypothetical protein [Actinomycetales bacterium]
MRPHLLDPGADLDLDATEPPWAADLVADLGLDPVLDAMADGDRLVRAVARAVLLAPAPPVPVVRHRHDVLADCLRTPRVVRGLYADLGALLDAARRVHGSFLRTPAHRLRRSRQILELCLPVLRDMRDRTVEQRDGWSSTGLGALAATLAAELDEAFFDSAGEHLRLLADPTTVMRAGLGPGLQGVGHALVLPAEDHRSWIARLATPHPGELVYRVPERDEAGARALAELRDRGLVSVADAVGEAAEHVLDFCRALRTELAFYVGALALAERLAPTGVPLCVPDIAVGGEAVLVRVGDLRDVALALVGAADVVGNDLEARDARLVLVTGANRGGKSTFLRALGQAQLMGQAGTLVAARHAALPRARHVVSHFRRGEDEGLHSGKLAEELARMSTLVDHLAPGDLVLANESFASTDEREGAEIARQVLEPLLDAGVRVALVTHLTDLALGWSDAPPAPTVYLRADPPSSAPEPFRLRPGRPESTSHGVELADRLLPAG